MGGWRGGGEGPGGCLHGIRGRGAKYFFSGPKGPPSYANLTLNHTHTLILR